MEYEAQAALLEAGRNLEVSEVSAAAQSGKPLRENSRGAGGVVKLAYSARGSNA